MAEIQILRSTGAVVVVGEVDFDNLLEQAREAEKLRTQLSQRLQQLEFLEGYAGSYTAGWREAFDAWVKQQPPPTEQREPRP